MAKPKFDMSLLKPVKETSGFDESLLRPIEEEAAPYEPPPERKGATGILEDIKEIPGHLMDYGYEIGSQIPDFWKQVVTNPKRAAKNFALGAGETVEAIPNLLGQVGPYFKKRGVSGLGALPGFQIPDLGIEKAMDLGGQQPGDVVARNMFLFGGAPKLLKAIPGVNAAGKRLKEIKKHSALKAKLEELEKAHEIKSNLHGEEKQAFNALKDIFESEPELATGTPSLLRRKSREAEQGLGALRNKQETIPENLRATEEPMAPELPKSPNLPERPKTTPLSLVEPERAEQLDLMKFEKPEVSKAPIEKAEAEHAAHVAKTAEHEANISSHLGEGLAHRRRVATKLNPILEKNANEIGEGFENYIEGLKGKNVALENPRDAKTISNEISHAIKNGGYDSPEVKSLAQELESIGKTKGDSIPADKFVASYRTLKRMAQKVRSSAYGKPEEERLKLLSAADSMESDLVKMEGVLDKGLGKENLQELNHLKHRWASEVTPLYKNKFYQEMRAKSKAPKGMMEHLTNEPYIRSTNPNKITGTQILNEHIKGDPELLRHVLGEKYAKNPSSIHEAGEIENEYIQHAPELQKMRNEHFESTQNESKAKLNVERAKHEHKLRQEQENISHEKRVAEARAQNKEARQEAEERTRLKKAETHAENERMKEEHKQESERIKAEHKKETERVKAEHKQKEEHFKIHEQIKTLESKGEKLKIAADKMHERAKSKNITLKEKLAIEKDLKSTRRELDKIEKDKKILRRLYKGLGYSAAAVVLGVPTVNTVKSLSGYHG